LPVELTEFELVPYADFVEVSWATASELNNEYFTIERRHEGAEQFEAVATLPGAGTTQNANRYRYNDYSISPGLWYYRIKQTDYDGRYTYSQVKSVEVSGKGLWQVFPNPSDGQDLHVRFTIADVNKPASITVLDAQGKRVHVEYTTVSSLTVPVQLQQKLPAGMYLVIIRTPDDAVQLRWVVR
jgi:hypothetical protein